MSQLDGIIAEGVRAWLGEQLKSKNIMNYNGANLAFTHARDTARKLGLSEEDIAHLMPYPASIRVESQAQPEQKKQNSWAAPALAALLSAALATGGTYYLLKPDKPDVPITQPGDGEVGFEVE